MIDMSVALQEIERAERNLDAARGNIRLAQERERWILSKLRELRAAYLSLQQPKVGIIAELLKEIEDLVGPPLPEGEKLFEVPSVGADDPLPGGE